MLGLLAVGGSAASARTVRIDGVSLVRSTGTDETAPSDASGPSTATTSAPGDTVATVPAEVTADVPATTATTATVESADTTSTTEVGSAPGIADDDGTDDGSTPSVARWVLRALGYVAITLVAGVVVAQLFLWRHAWSSRRVRWAGIGASVVGIGATVFELFVAMDDLDASLSDVLDTRVGGTFGVRFVLFLVVTAVFLARFIPRAVRWWIAAVVTVGLLVTWAWAGSSRALRWPGLGVPVDVVHHGAAAAWIGGLAVIFLGAFRDAEPIEAGGVVQRFGRLTTAAVVAVVVTGIVQTVRLEDGVGDLVDIAHGRLLIVKVGLLALIVMVANVNRRRINERVAATGTVPSPGLAIALRRAMGTELVVGLAIIGVSAALVANPPGIVAGGGNTLTESAPATSVAPSPSDAVTTTEPADTTEATETSAATDTTEPSATSEPPDTTQPPPTTVRRTTTTRAPSTTRPPTTTSQSAPTTTAAATTTTEAPCVVDSLLRNGDEGDEVRCLQEALIARGFLQRPADGNFGDETEDAVRVFQSSEGLIVDGLVGRVTGTALGIWRQ